MSDGNFNRSMLPYNSYQSGFRAGHARMKLQALEALTEILKEKGEYRITEKDCLHILSDFQSRLSKYIP